MERLSRRSDDADLRRRSRGLEHAFDPAREFQRRLADVARRHHLFSLGSRRTGHALRVRYAFAARHARVAGERFRHHGGVRGRRRGRVLAVRGIARLRSGIGNGARDSRDDRGRHAAAASALAQGRHADRERRHFAHRRARRVRGARIDPDDSGRARRHPHDRVGIERRESRSGMVAGRPVDRVFLRRIRRVRLTRARSERVDAAARHPDRVAVVLLFSGLVARQQEDRVRRQVRRATLRRRRERRDRARRDVGLRRFRPEPIRRHVVAR